MVQAVKYPALSLHCPGHCCGMGSIPGPGTSTCHKKIKKNKTKQNKQKKNHKEGITHVDVKKMEISCIACWKGK